MIESGEAVRGVVSISLPPAICTQLGAVADSMSRRAPGLGLELAWMAPASYHVCLAYLGWFRPEAITAIDDVMRDVAAEIQPFAFALRGIFPNAGGDAATAIVAGVASSPQLQRLSSALASKLGALGFAVPAATSFDVVIARAKRPGSLGPLCVTHGDDTFSTVPVQMINLINTELKSNSYDLDVMRKRVLGIPSEVAKCQTVPVQTSMYDAALSTDDGWMPGERHQDAVD